MEKILFLAAEPTDLHRIRVGQEARDIGQMLQLGRYRDRFKLEQRFAVRATDVVQAMHDLKPKIVHLSGHSTSKGEFCLEDESGKMRAARPDGVVRLLKPFGKHISCVLINACDSKPLAKAIAPHVGYAIGMNKPITDDAAVAFSTGFYQALAAGEQVPAAFEFGLAQIGLTGLDEASTPVLFKGTGTPRLDIRPVSHLPVVVALGCSDEEYRGMVAEALRALSDYETEERSISRSLDQIDYSIHQREWLPSTPEEWSRLALAGRELIARLGRRVPGPKVYHFFMRAPVCLALGLGACLGAKHEIVIHHHQPGASESNYIPAIDLSGGVSAGEAAHILRTPAKGKPKQIDVRGLDDAKGKVFVAISLAQREPAQVKPLAKSKRASLVEIEYKSDALIPADSDWTALAREVITVLLKLLRNETVKEVHLFPAAPVPMTFAIGMALDTRSPVAVHQWYAPESAYREVFRLNELGAIAGDWIVDVILRDLPHIHIEGGKRGSRIVRAGRE